ncbi:MAG: vWA domain-containing protein [Myxococcota bacterium]
MELTGLSLTQVLAVLGGFGATVVALYLLKLRRRRVSVPFVKLWEAVLAERQTTRLFSQLKRWLSLLVALAVVALLAFALGDPRPVEATREGRNLVVLMDASASMQATDVATSRFERAREEVDTLIGGLAPADRMLIAQMDAHTRPASPLTGDVHVLREALRDVAPADVSADLGSGLRLALDVLRGRPNGEIVLVTDGALGQTPELEERVREAGVGLSSVRVGEDDANVGISAFSVRRYPLDKSQTEVLVELWNPTDVDRRVELTLLGDGEPVEVQRLGVGAGERLRRFFRNVSGVDRTLEARIAPADDLPDRLPVDDRAWARLPERRRARVLVVTEGNLYLEAALLLDEYLEVTEVTPDQYAADGSHDVVIFDRVVPGSPPQAPALYLYPDPPEGAEGPLSVRGTIERPYFDTIDRDHPLVQFATGLHHANVAEALDVAPAPEDEVVAADRRGPLLVAGHRGGQQFVAMTFDLAQSDLPLRVAWPLLVLNTVNWFVQEEGGFVSSYETGRDWHIPVPEADEFVTVVDPDGREREVAVVQGRAVYSGRRAGLYTLRTSQGDELLAANLGPTRESDITPPERLEVAGREPGAVSQAGVSLRREFWVYFVLAVLAILLVEWLTYHRRWTV